MRTLLRLAVLNGIAASCAAALAQATAPAPTAPLPSPAAAPRADLRVVEDEQVRIEETRSRGQLQRIVVHTKLGGPRSYEIIVGAPGRDPSQERGAAGQRTWSLLSF